MKDKLDDLLGQLDKPFKTPEESKQLSEDIFKIIVNATDEIESVWELVDPSKEDVRLITKVFKTIYKHALEESFGNMFVYVDMPKFYNILNDKKLEKPRETFIMMVSYIFGTFVDESMEHIAGRTVEELFKTEENFKNFTKMLLGHSRSNFINADNDTIKTIIILTLMKKLGIDKLEVTEQDVLGFSQNGLDGVDIGKCINNGTVTAEIVKDIKE